MSENKEKKAEERAYAMRTRGIALMILGAIPTLIGFAGLRGEDGQGYTEPFTIGFLIVGLVLIGLGIMVWGRSRV